MSEFGERLTNLLIVLSRKPVTKVTGFTALYQNKKKVYIFAYYIS